MGNDLPRTIDNIEQLEDLLSTPSAAAIECLRRVPGDILILGVGGKMGPTLARMAIRAAQAAGTPRRVIGVARFTQPGLEAKLQAAGVETIRCDLLDRAQMAALPDAPNVISMAAMKFGASSNPSATWAMNVHLPSLVCERFSRSRILAFSTGNVYPFATPESGGSCESDPCGPIGEYPMTGLGRERMYEHFSRTLNLPVALLRLNYACELRYGVLVDIARRVAAGDTIDLAMGYANVIWQGDANAMSLAALEHVGTPPWVINIAGPEILSVRSVCEEFGRLLGREPVFRGVEAADAYLSNGERGHQLFGLPRVSASQLIEWIADWVRRVGIFLDRPTKFEVRDGKY